MRFGAVHVLLLVGVMAGCSSGDASAEAGDNDVVATAPLFTAPAKPHAAKFPIVFVHAFNASSTNDWSFNGVKDALTKDGHYVVLADVPPFAGTPARAAELVKVIDAAREGFCRDAHPDDDESGCTAATKVNLIGHSQGGLDARYAASKLGAGEHVASITTISSPHGGTPLGDIGVAALRSDTVDTLAEKLFALIGFVRSPGEAGLESDIKDAFFWLSEERATSSDETLQMPDVPGVVYQSWAGVATIGGRLPADVSACEGGAVLPHAPAVAGKFGLSDAIFFVPLIPAFHDDQIPNDGHIPVKSARYGEFQGCIPGDHLTLIGRPDDARRGVLVRTGFDHLTFYRVIADRLGARGL